MKKLVFIFATVQIIGVACSWFWQHPYSSASSFLWGVGLFLLLPGNVLGSWLVEKLFWGTHLTLGAMSVVSAVLCVGINAVIWFGIAAICRRLFHRRPRAARPAATI
jgi:hypothetical protein